LPNFWLGPLLIIIFSVELKWLPLGGRRDLRHVGGAFDLWDSVSHMTMPVSVLALGIIASISRYVRADALEVMGDDYIRTARAKGLRESTVFWQHILRNALIPVATFWGNAFKQILRDRLSVAAAVALIALTVLCVVGPPIAERELHVDVERTNVRERYQPPSDEHPFGTDHLGRDLLIRLLFGGRISLAVAYSASALSMTIGLVIGVMAGVNPSTVVRTAQSLGYKGFPELQDALRKQLMRQAHLSQRLQIGSQQLIDNMRKGQMESGETSILQVVLQEEIDNLLNLTQHVPVEVFEKAVDLLDNARRVVILGLGTSFAPALNFGNILRYVRSNILVLKPGIDPLPSQLETLFSDDLLFTICFARYTRETLIAMEYARKIGARVIALTDSLVSPAAQRADLSLIVPYRLWLYGNSVAVFALLNSLTGALFVSDPEAAEKRLEHLEFLFETFQIFTPLGGT
jgi:DNA-binding MurR/RpiR family transcriptional regulator